jgi:serpin B
MGKTQGSHRMSYPDNGEGSDSTMHCKTYYKYKGGKSMSPVQIWSVVILTLFAVSLVWCSPPTQGQAKADVNELLGGNTQFAFDLYAQLAEQEGNLFFSPYSISTALGMTFAGARGATARQMSEVQHFSLEGEKLHRAFGQLESQLAAVQEKGIIRLNVANALWAQKDYRFLDQFFELVTTHYRAQLSYADFKAAYEAARQEINAWVERQTNDKIKELLKPGVLDALTRLVLVNAIYFKGLWASQFEEKATEDAPFWVKPDTSVDVPMMFQEEEFGYTEAEDLQIIALPYEGNDLSMIILLPKEVSGLGQLERSLTWGDLDSWLASLEMVKLRVYLPRFKITSEFGLAQTLRLMGMLDAFDPNRADFSGMDGTRMLFISAVVHKAFVDVNEEGTEAAAATGVVLGLTSVAIPPPVFRADHPFLFLIRDNRSGSILFTGRLADPTK